MFFYYFPLQRKKKKEDTMPIYIYIASSNLKKYCAVLEVK